MKDVFAFVARLSGREKVIFYVTAAIVSIVLLERLMLNPILSDMRRLDKDIAEKEAFIRDALSVVSREKAIQERLNQIKPYLKKEDSDDAELNSLQKYVRGLASESSITVAELKSANKKEEGQFKKYFVKLTCNGKLEDLVALFHDIATSDRMLRIERWSMAPKERGPEEKGPKIINCTMNISKAVLIHKF